MQAPVFKLYYSNASPASDKGRRFIPGVVLPDEEDACMRLLQGRGESVIDPTQVPLQGGGGVAHFPFEPEPPRFRESRGASAPKRGLAAGLLLLGVGMASGVVGGYAAPQNEAPTPAEPVVRRGWLG
mgnify:CR=1 FL=1